MVFWKGGGDGGPDRGVELLGGDGGEDGGEELELVGGLEFEEPEFDEPEFDEPEFDEPEFDEPEFDESEFDEPEFEVPGLGLGLGLDDCWAGGVGGLDSCELLLGVVLVLLDPSFELVFVPFEPPAQFPVGFPHPFPPATGHQIGSGSEGDQSVIGGDVVVSYSST